MILSHSQGFFEKMKKKATAAAASAASSKRGPYLLCLCNFSSSSCILVPGGWLWYLECTDTVVLTSLFPLWRNGCVTSQLVGFVWTGQSNLSNKVSPSVQFVGDSASRVQEHPLEFRCLSRDAVTSQTQLSLIQVSLIGFCYLVDIILRK